MPTVIMAMVLGACASGPSEAALEAIRRIEDFDRGLYGGPIGWFGHRETWCAAAIRSGRLRVTDACLYAGAGIVAGSVEPDRQTTGMVLSHQCAAHALLETTPFALGVAHTTCTQLFPYLRMTVADHDLAPLRRHLELLAEGDRINRNK